MNGGGRERERESGRERKERMIQLNAVKYIIKI
jgi:hypothetical protein